MLNRGQRRSMPLTKKDKLIQKAYMILRYPNSRKPKAINNFLKKSNICDIPEEILFIMFESISESQYQEINQKLVFNVFNKKPNKYFFLSQYFDFSQFDANQSNEFLDNQNDENCQSNS